MLSGRPSRSLGPGSSSRKKSASCSSKDRSPLGTIAMSLWSEHDSRELDGGVTGSGVDPAGTSAARARMGGEAELATDWRNKRSSSAMSLAVLYRSDARFESAVEQIRSSSLGIVSSIWRGGRGSK